MPSLPQTASARLSNTITKRYENGRALFRADAWTAMSAAKRRIYDPKRQVRGNRKTTIKSQRTRDSAPSAPPRWTLAGAILGSSGALPAPNRLCQRVKYHHEVGTNWSHFCVSTENSMTFLRTVLYPAEVYPNWINFKALLRSRNSLRVRSLCANCL